MSGQQQPRPSYHHPASHQSDSPLDYHQLTSLSRHNSIEQANQLASTSAVYYSDPNDGRGDGYYNHPGLNRSVSHGHGQGQGHSQGQLISRPPSPPTFDQLSQSNPPSLNPNRRNPASYAGPTLKVIQWTPQSGEEGTQVTIILDSLAIKAAQPSATSLPLFGQASPALQHTSPVRTPKKFAPTRRFSVLFGAAAAPTKYTRANVIDGNGVGASMNSGADPDDAFVVLTTFVPARQSMGSLDERVMVVVQVLDERSELVEDCIVGEWDAQPILPITPTRTHILKRTGEELLSEREPPALRTPVAPAFRSHHSSPVIRHASEWLSSPNLHPPTNQLLSPQPARLSPMVSPRVPPSTPGGKVGAANLRHPPPESPALGTPVQPGLLRTSQIPSTGENESEGAGAPVSTFSNKAQLRLQGDLHQMAMGWSNEEWTTRRRLIQFWRQQEGNVINATFRPITQDEFVPNSIVISCIFRDEWNECFVTSVDTIYLLEALVGVRFTVEEKNRIRRNLEGFKPMTVSKSKAESEPFFKLIMGFPNPKPRNIEKDVKVFPWKVLTSALKKIISKYSATYTAPTSSPVLPAGLGADELGSPKGTHDHFGNELRMSASPAIKRTLGSPQVPHASPRIDTSIANAHSPHVARPERFAVTQPNSPALGGSPMLHHSVPNSPHLNSGNQAHHSPYLGAPVPQVSNPTPLSASHTRPGSFDFGSILDGSNFAHTTSYGTGSGPGSGHHLFPPHELAPPAMVHSRSYSEQSFQPRRSFSHHAGIPSISFSSGNTPTYSGPGPFEGQAQDVYAGFPSDTWGTPVTTSFSGDRQHRDSISEAWKNWGMGPAEAIRRPASADGVGPHQRLQGGLGGEGFAEI